jgi:nucleoside-diphosphate-sugar epimerase
MSGEVPEHWILTPREFHNTDEQSKAEAEEIVRAECQRGMPITVHRPSMVVGDRNTGRIIHFQVFYHLCEFLAGKRTLGLSPDFGAARLDTVPADYVARIIYWSSTRSSTVGRVLHACSGPSYAMSLGALRDHVRQAFRSAGQRLPPIITLPPRAFSSVIQLASIFMSASTKRAVRTLPVFLDYLATDQAFANHQTQALLSNEGIGLPAPVSYLNQVLSFYLECQSRRSAPS